MASVPKNLAVALIFRYICRSICSIFFSVFDYFLTIIPHNHCHYLDANQLFVISDALIVNEILRVERFPTNGCVIVCIVTTYKPIYRQNAIARDVKWRWLLSMNARWCLSTTYIILIYRLSSFADLIFTCATYMQTYHLWNAGDEYKRVWTMQSCMTIERIFMSQLNFSFAFFLPQHLSLSTYRFFFNKMKVIIKSKKSFICNQTRLWTQIILSFK